jgi:hypothetical protein
MTTTKARAFDANEGPGLARLRRAKNAEAIRAAVLADQKEALAGKAPPAAPEAPQAASAAPDALPQGKGHQRPPAARA